MLRFILIENRSWLKDLPIFAEERLLLAVQKLYSGFCYSRIQTLRFLRSDTCYSHQILQYYSVPLRACIGSGYSSSYRWSSLNDIGCCPQSSCTSTAWRRLFLFLSVRIKFFLFSFFFLTLFAYAKVPYPIRTLSVYEVCW